MPEQHITSQPYSFHGPLCEIAKGCDEHLCGVGNLSFFVYCAAAAGVIVHLAALAFLIDYKVSGAEDVVYRRHAEVRSLSINAGER